MNNPSFIEHFTDEDEEEFTQQMGATLEGEGIVFTFNRDLNIVRSGSNSKFKWHDALKCQINAR